MPGAALPWGNAGPSSFMNQVDLLVIVVVGACTFSGARRGLILSAGDIVALALGLLLGSLCYPIGAGLLGWIFGLSAAAAGALGFALVTVLLVVLTAWGFSLLSRRFEVYGVPSRVGGAAFGVAYGAVLAAVIILLSGILPGGASAVAQSALGPRLIALVPRLHEGMESAGFPLPKLVRLPTDYKGELEGGNVGLQFLRVNFTRLDGATCLNCRSAVEFEGYRLSRGTLMSPEFRCPKCGRTSDGCQTFEGFHAIYGQCPVVLADEGLRFDCGVWTNGWWTVPHGQCPVCGRMYRPRREGLHGRGAATHVGPAVSWLRSKMPSSEHHSAKVARLSPA